MASGGIDLQLLGLGRNGARLEPRFSRREQPVGMHELGEAGGCERRVEKLGKQGLLVRPRATRLLRAAEEREGR